MGSESLSGESPDIRERGCPVWRGPAGGGSKTLQVGVYGTERPLAALDQVKLR